MKQMKISEIIKVTNALTDYQGEDVVKGVSTDTRTLQKGEVYFALKGKNYNGHEFISVAEKKGASAVVCSEEIKNCSIPILKVDDTLKALQKLASYYRNKLKIKVIAVTGSNGKTTTKNMIATVLSHKYKVFFTDRNFNNEIGLPKSILDIDETYDCAVLEMGMNNFGEISLLSKIAKPDIAVITNIGKAHIGNLGSQENILSAKLEILDGLKSSGTIILNSGDTFLKNLNFPNFETLFVGVGSELSVSEVVQKENSLNFNILHSSGEYKAKLPIIGSQNATNALFAIACGLKLGINIQESLEKLKRYSPPPMRMEVVNINGITIIKDYYNSSPDSCKKAIESLSEYSSSGNKIAILGQILELGNFSKQEHYELGTFCALKQLDKVFFFGKDYESFKKGMQKHSECFETKNALLEGLKSYVLSGKLKKGDVILIKGSRDTKMETVYELLKVYIQAGMGLGVPNQYSQTKLYVDVNAIKYNYFQILKEVGDDVEVMPMVKANAYGAGAEIISNIFYGSKYLAVADTIEASRLREMLPNKNIVIIYQPTFEEIPEIVKNDLIPAVSDINFIKELNLESIKQNKVTRVHVEVDTGHGRLGVNPKDISDFALTLKELKNLDAEGIFMHYATADTTDEDSLAFTQKQTQIFKQSIEEFEKVYGAIKYKHACAGAAIFNPKACRFNMVRPGYLLYGYHPEELTKHYIKLKPSLKLVSKILQIREVEKGTSISYGRKFITSRKSKIATVSIGYSDGIPRKLFDLKNKQNGCFVVSGQRAPIVGTICMDLTMIDITDIVGKVEVGDEVAIFDNINVTIEEMAEICGTIGYEIIAQIQEKTERIEIF